MLAASVIFSSPEIKEIKALAGKKIATASIGGSVDMVLRLGLKASGVDPKSVIFLSAGAPQTRMAAVTSGQMDATIVPPENLAAVEKTGLRVVKDLSELDFYVQHTGLVVRKSQIKENRGMVKNFLAPIMDAVNFYRTHEAETLDILAKFTGISDRDALKHSYDFHKKLFLQPPYPSRDGFSTLLAEIGDSPPIWLMSSRIFFSIDHYWMS